MTTVEKTHLFFPNLNVHLFVLQFRIGIRKITPHVLKPIAANVNDVCYTFFLLFSVILNIPNYFNLYFLVFVVPIASISTISDIIALVLALLKPITLAISAVVASFFVSKNLIISSLCLLV